MTSRQTQYIELLWQTVVNAERTFVGARMAFVQAAKPGGDIVPILKKALGSPSERGTALRLLLMLDESIRQQVFPALVELASVGHADIQLVRDVIRSIDAAWVQEHIADEIENVLGRSPTYEEYRRLAELLDMLHSPYLSVLVDQAARSDDLDIHEVASDYGGQV